MKVKEGQCILLVRNGQTADHFFKVDWSKKVKFNKGGFGKCVVNIVKKMRRRFA
ncbi:hypothetical protein CHCC14814_0827 [Bacillus paralicheniformis]|nr:hypothetical protein CHCC14814_0827 [Bacillus paralicheniformis]